jgi:hypothetical protein
VNERRLGNYSIQECCRNTAYKCRMFRTPRGGLTTVVSGSEVIERRAGRSLRGADFGGP